MIDINRLDLYLELKKSIKESIEELQEIESAIKDFGYNSVQIDDMPKSTSKSDKMDKLINLIGKKSNCEFKINGLNKHLEEEFIYLQSYCKSFKSKFKQRAYKLKYIDGLTYAQISKKLKKSYWAVIKLFNRA